MAQKTIVVRIVGDAGQFVGSMAAAGTSVQAFGNQAAAASTKATSSVSRLGGVAATVGKITTLGVAAGLALSAKAAIDFESAFAGVRKTVNASESGFKQLADQLIQMSTVIPISVNELAKITELGGQLGVDYGGLRDFTEVIAEIGVSTNLSTEQAALSFARLDNIMGLGQKSFRNLGSTIVELGNNFATTEDEIVTFTLRIAPAAATVGILTNEAIAIGTAFSSVGVAAERGGTAIQKTIIAIDKAAQTGGDTLETFAMVAGITAEEFKNLAENDPSESFRLFVEGLARVRAEGKNVFAILKDVGLGNERVVQALLAASNASGLLTSALDSSERAWEENIALTEEAEKRFQTTASKMELAKNQVKAFSITVGQTFLPVVGDMVEGVQDLVVGFQELPGPLKAVATALLAAITAATLAQTSYKILAKIVGVDFVAAAGRAAFAAAAMKGAIGFGLLLAVGLVTKAVVDYGQSQRDAELRTLNLVDAIEQEREGMEGLTLARIKDQLVAEGHLDLLNRTGIGLDTFGRAVMGEADALKIVNGILKDTIDEAQNIADTDPAIFDVFSGAGEGPDEAQRRVLDAARDAHEASKLLLRNTNELTLAYGDFEDSLVAAGASKNFDAITKGFDGIDEAFKEAALSGESAGKAIASSIALTDDAFNDVESSLGDFGSFITDQFNEIDEELRGQISLWDEMGDAVKINVDEMIANVLRQVTAQGDFLALTSGLDISQGLRDHFDAFTHEQRAGAVLLAENAPADFARWVEALDSILGPNGEVATNVMMAFGARFPEIIRSGGSELIGALNSVVETMVSEGSDPVEAWLGTMESAIILAGEELRPTLTEAINSAFRDSGFSGEMFGLGEEGLQGFIDGMYSMFPELARVMFGMRDTVTATMKGAFEIRSPSRVMMGLGQQVGEGFALGIDMAARQFFPNMPSAFMRGSIVGQGPTHTQSVTNTTSSPTTVIINNSKHNDLRSDISSGLIAGGVTRQVETLVKR
jgi:TP901 family phage tail tape measure protein